jgi:hypothetical protein
MREQVSEFCIEIGIYSGRKWWSAEKICSFVLELRIEVCRRRESGKYGRKTW